jgi:hypothetical protein
MKRRLAAMQAIDSLGQFHRWNIGLMENGVQKVHNL